jgi:predicted nucleic acid-binding protein
MILLDTNVLIHSKLATSRHYAAVTERLTKFYENEEDLVICPQVLYEFYVVATRPSDKNGLGIGCQDALNEIDNLQETFTLISDPTDLFINWMNLVKKYQTLGKPAHDTRLVAFMQGHGITHIYTLNPADLVRYNSVITILN